MLPLRFVCSVKVARLEPESVTERVVVCVEVRPEGVLVVTDGTGTASRIRGGDRAARVVVVVVPSGTVTLVTPLGENCKEL